MSARGAAVERAPGDNGDFLRLLDGSAERDLWLRRLLAAERDAYDLGYERGVEDGRRAALAEEAAQRRAAAALVHDGPAFAELERRRWGPGGRSAFGEPWASDYPGRGGEAA